MREAFETLLVSVDGPILDVVLNRPEKRNALNFAMVRELDEVLGDAKLDDAIRVVTVRGAGKVFSAGHDLGDVKAVAEAEAKRTRHPDVDPLQPPALMRSWYFPKPLIAGVHGFVGPEAMKMIATFDFVIAARDTRFSYEQTRIRTSAPGGNPLVFLLPMRVWKKLVLMGGWFDAEQALGFHFVQRVVEEAELQKELRRWAAHLADGPAEDIQIAKLGIHRQYELMGMANMELVQNRITERRVDLSPFWQSMEEQSGLAEALRARDADVDPGISQV
jgi:enoyl-CoA hydratase/carnithine racemase